MSARWLSCAAAMLLLGFPQAAAAQDAQPPKFKSSVDVVSVTAVVRDRKGRFVENLRQEDFVVLESGQARRILDFRAETDGPVKLGVLMDASGSMRVGSKAIDALEAARQLLSALRQNDEAAVFSFDTRLDRVTDFTTDAAALEAALHRLNPPFGQTSMYDAIAEAAAFVATAARSAGGLSQRSALVVLTDDIDTRSQFTAAEVTAIASRIDVPVYIVAVMAPIDDPSVDRTPAFNVSDLRQLAAGTGGEMFTATAPAHASVAARRIVEELRHQYVLAFEASPHAGWKSLEVRARDGKLAVRARTGYVAGGSDPAEEQAFGLGFGEWAAPSDVACGSL